MKRVGVLVLAGVALVGGALGAAARWAPAAIQPAAARAELTRLISDAVDRVDLDHWATEEQPAVPQVALRDDVSTEQPESATYGSPVESICLPALATATTSGVNPACAISTSSGVEVASVDTWVAAPQFCLDLASTGSVSGSPTKAGESPCRVHVVMFSGTREGWRTESRMVRGLGKS